MVSVCDLSEFTREEIIDKQILVLIECIFDCSFKERKDMVHLFNMSLEENDILSINSS